jgi:hypothetical protein
MQERASDEADEGAAIAATERWFLRRGIPHFIEDYSAGEDVFTRTLPVLALVLLAQLVSAVNLDWPWWANVGALIGAVALVAAGWAGINLVRGEPAWRMPERVGPAELAAFVVLPALPPLVFGGQVQWAAFTALGNLLLLGLIYLVTSYGLVPMTRWAFGQTAHQLGAVTGLLGRALPLLLLFSVTLFINTEVWQVAATLDALLMGLTILLFVLVGTLFLFSRLPGEMRALARGSEGRRVAHDYVGTPLAGLVGEGDPVPAPPLSRRQKGNVVLVLLFSQGVQVALVTLLMGLFFLGFGMLAIRPEVVATWLGDLGPSATLWSFQIGDHLVVLSRALVNVALFLAVLSGFYFTVYAVIDPTYREQFFDGIVDEVRQAVTVRAAYLAVRGRVRARTPAEEPVAPGPSR